MKAEGRNASATLDNPSGTIRLTVVTGRALGQKFKVEGSATIGRSSDTNVMLDDPEVSRLHARVQRLDSGEFAVEDLGSKNGTFVNGTRVQRRVLVLGDKLRIGPRVVLEISGFDVLEEQMIQRQRFEAIGRLGVGIAHDLNNVLAALDAGAAYLGRLPPELTLGNGEVRECLVDLTLAAARARELTRGILSFVRGQAAARSTVDVSELVTEVARLLRHTFDRSIEIECVAEPNVLVHGNHSELHQVLLNLCLNARDAMVNGGILRVGATWAKQLPVELRGAAPGDFAELWVSDTGVGMDEITQARIFEPLFTTKHPGSGYGIGLSTVREIVGFHGGRITLESRPGRGTTFYVHLPALDRMARRRSTTDERSATPPPRQLRAGITLLLVDDEHVVRRSMARLLRHAGFEVTEAEDGAEAVGRYAAHRHDLVLLDLDMPGLDGEQTQSKLLDLDPLARIVFATGQADPKREIAVRARGALAFLQKPYSLDALLEVVERALESHRDSLWDETRPL